MARRVAGRPRSQITQEIRPLTVRGTAGPTSTDDVGLVPSRFRRFSVPARFRHLPTPL